MNESPSAAPNPSAATAPLARLKRRYTGSDLQRETGRRNIRIAQAVAAALMRAPGYKPSPRRQAATHANLQRASEVRLHSACYASRFRHGLSAVSLERSLALAGESPEEYRAHLHWFQHELIQGISTLPGIPKLADALGQAVWRRLRVFRTLPEWEMLAVSHSLRRLALERRAGEALTKGRLLEWAGELEYALEAGRLRVAGRCRTLDHRVEALACQLLFESGREIFHCRGGVSRLVVGHADHRVETLGNSLAGSRRVEAALARAGQPVVIAGPETWRRFGSGRQPICSLFSPDELPVPLLQDRLLPQCRKREAEGQPAVLRCFEDFLKLVEGALGGRGSGTGEQGLGEQGTGAGDDSFADDRQSSTPDLTPNVARPLWERLQFFRQQQENEAGELQAWIRAYTASLLCAGVREPAGTLVRCLRDLADKLKRGELAFRRVQGVEHGVRQAVYRLLVERFGEQPEFREFKPPAPDTSNLLIRAMLLNSLGRKEEAESLAELSDEIQERARGSPGEVRSQELGARS